MPSQIVTVHTMYYIVSTNYYQSMYLVCTLMYLQNENKSIIWWQRFSIKRENDAKGFLILLFFQTIKSNLTPINFRLDVTKYSNYIIKSTNCQLRICSLITLTRGGRLDYWKWQSFPYNSKVIPSQVSTWGTLGKIWFI